MRRIWSFFRGSKKGRILEYQFKEIFRLASLNYVLHISLAIHYNGAMDIARCYKILEIEPDASLEEVKQVYRDLVCVWHPDRFSNNPRLREKAEEKLKQVNLAYEVVTNPQRSGCPQSAFHAKERRKHPRNPCAIVLNHATFDRPCSSMYDFIQDISAGGVFIKTNEQFVAGQTVTLSFALPRFGELLNLSSEVVRVCRRGVGVRFKVSPRYQKFLATFV